MENIDLCCSLHCQEEKVLCSLFCVVFYKKRKLCLVLYKKG